MKVILRISVFFVFSILILIAVEYSKKLAVNERNLDEKVALERARADIVWKITSDERDCDTERDADAALVAFREQINTANITEDVRAMYVERWEELETLVVNQHTASCVSEEVDTIPARGKATVSTPEELATLVAGTALTPSLSGLQISLIEGGETTEHFALGFAQLNGSKTPLTTDHKIRVASISKLIVAIGVMRLAEAGQLDLDADVSEYLGWPLRNPAFANTAITARQLLSHTSSVRDGSRYFIRAEEGQLRDFFDPASELWENGSHFTTNDAEAPGEFFEYSNLNFGLLGTVIENVSGVRFDQFMTRDVLAPMGLSASFNSCDVPAARRAAGFRKRPVDSEAWAPQGPWVEQVDGGEPQCFYGMDGVDSPEDFLETYPLGSNASLFSPQGGLRASADDLATVLRMLAGGGLHGDQRILKQTSVDAMLSPVWTLDARGRNGLSAGEAEPGGATDGLMTSYGLSVHRIDMRAWGFTDGPELLVGHLGEAYGVLSLALYDPETGDGIASIISGTSDNPAHHPGHSPLYRIEEEILRWWISRPSDH